MVGVDIGDGSFVSSFSSMFSAWVVPGEPRVTEEVLPAGSGSAAEVCVVRDGTGSGAAGALENTDQSTVHSPFTPESK